MTTVSTLCSSNRVPIISKLERQRSQTWGACIVPETCINIYNRISETQKTTRPFISLVPPPCVLCPTSIKNLSHACRFPPFVDKFCMHSPVIPQSLVTLFRRERSGQHQRCDSSCGCIISQGIRGPDHLQHLDPTRAKNAPP